MLSCCHSVRFCCAAGTHSHFRIARWCHFAEKGLRIRIANLFFKLLTCVLYIIRVVTDLDPTFATWWVFCVYFVVFFCSYVRLYRFCCDVRRSIQRQCFHLFRGSLLVLYDVCASHFYHFACIADNKSVHHCEHQTNINMKFIRTQDILRLSISQIEMVIWVSCWSHIQYMSDDNTQCERCF